ncbi:MAG: flagellar basal-body rod protein FlgF [Deltaproteobacteria bacterium]|nr:flagellar basal-body rod protein FlgF [Deltaproteobacteria bacterium]
MQNAFLVGLSRQVALGRELDVVANNIANLNTTGFKSDGAVFEEFIGPTARASGVSRADSRVSFVRDRATWIDMSQGTIERTGNSMDVAIDGSGFLAVQTPRGERYTRNGAMQVNANGEMVTSEGYQVLGENGPIVLQPKDRNVTISADGTISVREGNNAKTESQRGKLRLVGFERPGQLQKDGAGTFAAPQNLTAQPDTKSRVVQGAIEKSNVRAVVEMTRLIEVTRSYTQVATMLSQQDDLKRSAIEKLAEVPI